jgi:hypothetical protein
MIWIEKIIASASLASMDGGTTTWEKGDCAKRLAQPINKVIF